ncbi:MAG TPA: PQQ-dependent sugar dehydrogenase, partial [Pyrinomonadaceae bacterium]
MVAFVATILSIAGVRTIAATSVPSGFSETPVNGTWNDAVGITFETNGRMWVWERTGKIWIKDPSDSSPLLLLDIHDEVGAWEDHGMLGFVLDPNFRVNGYIYLLYIVDRYHLFNFGTPGYDPNANQYNAATIGRLTRYTCNGGDGFRSVSLASRLILIGETRQTGIPVLSYSHGVGSLVFGEDETLLLSTGDGATASGVDQGGG